MTTKSAPPVPLRFGRFYDGETNVACPVCGFDYSHIREVFSRCGSDESQGGYPGTITKGQSEARRDALVIVFDGECEHAWEWVIQQHKGINEFSATLVEPKRIDAA